MDDYEKTYGISIHHDKKGLKLKFVTNSSANENRKGYKSKDPRFRAGDDAPAANVGSRVYVLAGYGGGGTYEMWQMKNKEFSFEVDVSQLPCGLNGALLQQHARASYASGCEARQGRLTRGRK